MARRTKEEAQETRSRILDTAEHIFRERGVSRTSLTDIANAAGVTRGAIYWHFENKASLFQAMCDRATLPLENLLQSVADDGLEDPLGRLRQATVEILQMMEDDARSRRVFEILTHKCEFVEEMAPAVQRRQECRDGGVDVIERNFRNAIERGQFPRTLDPRLAAVGFFSYVDGLIHHWSLHPGSFSLARDAAALIDIYLDGLRGHRAGR